MDKKKNLISIFILFFLFFSLFRFVVVVGSNQCAPSSKYSRYFEFTTERCCIRTSLSRLRKLHLKVLTQSEEGSLNNLGAFYFIFSFFFLDFFLMCLCLWLWFLLHQICSSEKAYLLWCIHLMFLSQGNKKINRW